MQDQPNDAQILAAVAAQLGQPAVQSRPVVDRGYTRARRLILRLADGTNAFVKAGMTERTAHALRQEYRVYAQLQAPFVPRLLGWVEGPWPVLILEDLEDAEWPPPWSEPAVEAVLRTLAEVAATTPPAGLPPLAAFREELFSGWRFVAENPRPFLATGVVSEAWLTAALPSLLAAAHSVSLEGDALLHLDVRSDNLCLREGRAILIDWSFAAVGNPAVDLAAWLPSLHREGGPPPELLLPDGAALAALTSGFFAWRVGLPLTDPSRERLRQHEFAELQWALPWAARALGWPPPW
jgi:aminoglycoside phosphotransferase (APT) family kinase protein